MPSHRLDQFLAARGFGSRKDALRLIRKGAVCVNGLVAKSGAEKIHPESDRVDVSGKAIPMMDGCYLMLHKPKGVISASRDPKVATVLELIPEELRRRGLFPAGRLDKNSTGLLLLTNDGALAHALLSPRRHVPKTYLVRLREVVSEADAAAFAAGMLLPAADGHPPERCGPAELFPLEERLTKVILHEGKYHQIKRMFALLGNEVLELHRIAMGPLLLSEALRPGESRSLTEEEIDLLKKIEKS